MGGRLRHLRSLCRVDDDADRVRGRRMATVAKCQFDLEVCGGIYVDEPCVIDKNLVSGRTWHDNGHFVGPWIKLLRQARGDNN